MTNTTEDNELAKSLVYFVSRRGSSNYWATLINGCTKVYLQDKGTLSVGVTENWKYVLTCHVPFFEACSPKMKLLGLVHEAGHIALNHLPRLFKLLSSCTDPFVRRAVLTTFNWAADFATNDSIVRYEPGFKECHRPRGADENVGEFTFLLPEEWDLPAGKSMEEYIVLMLKDLPKIKKKAEKLLEKLLKDLEEKGEGSISFGEGEEESEDEGEGEDGGSGSGEDEGDGEGEGASPSAPKKKKKPAGTASVPGLPDRLLEEAFNSPETFEKLQELFDRLNGGAHADWNKVAENMTPEEAVSAGSKLKNHARQLAKSAMDGARKSRGYLPGHAQSIIDELLKAEQLPWDLFLRDVIQSAITARVSEEMASPNLSLINEDYIEPWPGQVLEFAYNITWMTDTSGSMSDVEYARACAAFNGLLGQNKAIRVTYCECDAAMQKEVAVTNIEPLSDEYLAEAKVRRGRGGTVYTPFFRRVVGADSPSDWVPGAPRLEDKHPKPDLIVVVTDGGVGINGECFPWYRPDCPIVWLVTPGNEPVAGMDDVPPDRVVQMFKMAKED